MPASVEIPITQRARQYGYVFWTRQLDEQMQELLGNTDVAEVALDGKLIGKRRVDWKYRRISVGPTHTKSLHPTLNSFRLAFEGNRLDIICI